MLSHQLTTARSASLIFSVVITDAVLLSIAMDLRQIRYFIAVAEDEHFGRASERIHIAQPALSRQIQLLEAELGVVLFDRLSRGVKLSAAGRAFRDRCTKILDDLGRAVSETQAIARGESGVLKLGFIEVAAWSGAIPDTIMAFQKNNPGVDLTLSSMTTLDQIDAINDGRIDAGFLYNAPADPSLTILPVSKHNILLAVPAKSDLAQRPSVTMPELQGQRFISFHRRESPAYSDELNSAFFNSGINVDVVHEAENEAEMLALVTVGVGMALVNECHKWRMPHGVKLLPVTDLKVGLDLSFVYRTKNTVPALRRFLDILTVYKET